MKARLFLNVMVPILASGMMAACSGGQDGQGDTQASVSAQVITQPATRGSLPNLITAYGTATASVDAAATLSIRAAGRVTRFDVVTGAAVKAGQPLLTFTLAPSAVANYAQSVTALKLARTQHEYAAQLLSQQLATRDQLAQAERALSDARATLQALREEQGPGKMVKLRAPYAGIVGSIDATQGQTLAAGAALLSLTREDGVVISAGLEPDLQHPVKPGDKATLLPLVAGPSITGTVLRVSNALNAQTHLIDTQIASDGAVTVGMGYRAEIEAGKISGWLVPRDALQGKDGRWFLYQVAAGKAVKVPVQVQAQDGPSSIVSGKLDPDRAIVTVGGTQLDDGMAVRVARLDGAQ